MTQPLYYVAQVEAMLAEARRRFGPRGFPVPMLLGVLPLQSPPRGVPPQRGPGITIPDCDAGRDARRRRPRQRGRLEQSLALLEASSARSGTYIMPSFGRYEQCAELVRRLGVASWRGRWPDAPLEGIALPRAGARVPGGVHRRRAVLPALAARSRRDPPPTASRASASTTDGLLGDALLPTDPAARRPHGELHDVDVIVVARHRARPSTIPTARRRRSPTTSSTRGASTAVVVVVARPLRTTATAASASRRSTLVPAARSTRPAHRRRTSARRSSRAAGRAAIETLGGIVTG
jgi:hypothetical protein